MKRLVVTADDFGLAPEINAAVEWAHEQGILTAASLMVAAAGAAHAIARARRLPRLRIGLHLVLVDGRPALSPERPPDLVDETGHLRTDLARLGLEICARPSVRAQVRAEIEAQFRAYQATGLALDHVNAPKHFHLHPAVAHEIIAIGRRYGMRGLRVPREPAAVLARVESGTKRSPGYVTPWLAALIAPSVIALTRRADVALGGYSDF